MVILKNKKLFKSFLILSFFSLAFAGIYNIYNKPVDAINFCSSEECKAAEQAEQEAIENANNAANAASTLEGQITLLNQEIAMYEARIAANEARKSDLETKIEENTKKLEMQQQALANLLVDIHFENKTETLMILASSSTISDFAERQSRVDTAKEEVNLSTQTIRSLKESLESQKTEIERIIADQEIQQEAITSKRDYQALLADQYRSNAAGYEADAAEARAKKLAEIEKARQAVLAQYGVGVSIGGDNSYPFKDQCPGQGDYWYAASWGTGLKCECVSYVTWMVMYEHGIWSSGWGNANNWDNTARRLGYRVDNIPSVGSVAQTDVGYWGHVAYVEAVYDDGTMVISDYNGAGGSFRFGRYRMSSAGWNFIHLD